MSNFLKYLLFFALLLLALFIYKFFYLDPQNKDKKTLQIPEKITMLFVTQSTCPSCDRLEETMELSRPKALLSKYFNIKKVSLGEELPHGLIPPNGTPTVYFLGAADEALLEPMFGEKDEERLMEFLEDALLEFKNLYKVDLVVKCKQQKENNETTN